MSDDDMPPARAGPVSLDTAFAGEAEVINLDHERFKLSREIARWIMILFFMSTVVIIGLVVVLAVIDVKMIINGHIKPVDRLITEKVIMTVIGASIVQVGAAAFAIVQSVFKVPPSSAAENADEIE